MVLGGESFGKRLGSEAQMGLYEVTDGISTLTKETLRGPWWKEWETLPCQHTARRQPSAKYEGELSKFQIWCGFGIGFLNL
jgi:hypothetical protein